ncbi:MAG: DUF5677 domain-containing protein [Candidatus Daviesbacteria bacterium]|nr:DUF5677 domain-containing protein [Candidatus Daviesbacteria bacterium]
MKIGRNDPCPCGSGKKYKKCCLGKDKEPKVISIFNSGTKLGEFTPFILKKSSKLFKYNNELRKIADEAIKREYYDQEDKQFFSGFFLGKAYKTHHSILTLCRQGQGENAAMLARSLFDLLITLLYILKDPTSYRLQRYADYDWVIRQNVYEYAKDVPDLIKLIEERGKNPKPQDNTPQEISYKAKSVQEKYKYKTYLGWSDKSLSKMAEEVGRKGPYRTVYNIFSQFIHTAPRVVNDYVKEKEGKFLIETGPTDNFVEEVLVASFDFFISILQKFDELNGELLKVKILDVEKRYLQKVNDINTEKN